MSETISRETARAVLALPMGENDANAATIGEYLTKLLLLVWEDGECFDGKRPFGNSSWETEIYVTLVRHELVTGTLDEDGYLDVIEYTAEADANELIAAAIREMGRTS